MTELQKQNLQEAIQKESQNLKPLSLGRKSHTPPRVSLKMPIQIEF